MPFRSLRSIGVTVCLAMAACSGPAGPAASAFTVRFDPVGGVLPSAIDLLFDGSPDGTLEPPGAHPSDLGDLAAMLGTLDGFSTTAPVRFAFSRPPRASDLNAGTTVRMFEVTLDGHAGTVASVVRELGAAAFEVRVDGLDPTGRTVAVVPRAPLSEGTSYLVMVSTWVRDADGVRVAPDRAYVATRRSDPLCEAGTSLLLGVDDAEACALEALRPRTAAQEAALAARGVSEDDVALAWTFTTQSLTPTLAAARQAAATSATATLFPFGVNTGAYGLPAIADVVVGRIDLPYFLSGPFATSPVIGPLGAPLPGPLGGSWRAAPCGLVASCAEAYGASNASTNLTSFNPVPVASSPVDVRAPVIVSVPNNQPMPASGWPVVVFVHDLGGNRLDVMPLAPLFAQLGYATVAIDLPLHGVTPWDYNTSLSADAQFWKVDFLASTSINQALFPGVAERTFSVDYADDVGTFGADGTLDRSGQHFVNVRSLLTTRDNLRQAIVDVHALQANLGALVIAGTGQTFDAANVAFVGVGLGATVVAGVAAGLPGTPRVVLSGPAIGLAASLDASPALGSRFRADALAAHGVAPGTPAYAAFLDAVQTILDGAEPLALAADTPSLAAARTLVHVVVGGATLSGGAAALPDQVFPPSLDGAPLAGAEAFARVQALASLTGSVAPSVTPVRRIARFSSGEHGSLLSPRRSAVHPPADPAGFQGVTTEMAGQVASFVFAQGMAVQVNAPALLAGD